MDLNQEASDNNQSKEHVILQEELQLALIHTNKRIASLEPVADLVLSKGKEANQLLDKFHTLLKDLTDDKDSIDGLLGIREYSASDAWQAKRLLIHNEQRGLLLEELANQLLSFEYTPKVDTDQIGLRSEIGKTIKANWVGMFTKENGYIAKFTKPNGTWGFVCKCGCVLLYNLQSDVQGESFFGGINFFGTNVKSWHLFYENIATQFEKTSLLHDTTCGRKEITVTRSDMITMCHLKHYPLYKLGTYLVYETDFCGKPCLVIHSFSRKEDGLESSVVREKHKYSGDFSYHPDSLPKEVGHGYFAMYDHQRRSWRLFRIDGSVYECDILGHLGFPTENLKEIPGADGTTGLFQTDKGVFSDPRNSRSFIRTSSVTPIKDIHNKTTDIYRTAENELIWNNKETKELKKLITLTQSDKVWIEYPWVTCLSKSGSVMFINLEDSSKNAKRYFRLALCTEYLRGDVMPGLAMEIKYEQEKLGNRSTIYIVYPDQTNPTAELVHPDDECLQGPHIKTGPSTSIEVEFLRPQSAFFRKKELPTLRIAYTNVSAELQLLSRFFKRSELHATGFAKPGTQAFEDFLKETYAFPEAGLVFYRDISGSRHFVYKDKQEEVVKFPLTFMYFTKAFVKGSDGLYRACIRTAYSNVHNYILTYDPETGNLTSQDVFRIIETKEGHYFALLGDMVIHKCTILNSQLEAIGELSDAVAERIDFAEKVVDNYRQKIDAFVDGIATFTDRKTKKPVYISKKGEILFEY